MTKFESKSITRTKLSVAWSLTLLVISSVIVTNNAASAYSLGFNNSQSFDESNQTLSLSKLQGRTIKITFDSIVIHNRHEFLTRGEWDLNAYVNDKKIPLMLGEKVWTGQQIDFSNPISSVNYLGGDRSITLILRENEELRIMITGLERDSASSGGSGQLDSIQNSKNSGGGTFEQYADKIKGLLSRLFGGFNHDDGVGLILLKYNSANNFGIGSHDEVSQYNGVNTDSKTDYNLRFRIEEIK